MSRTQQGVGGSSHGGTGVSRRARAAVGIALLLGLGGALAQTATALADTGDFAVTSYSDGQFVSGNDVTLTGTGSEGAQIRVTGSGVTPCTTTVDGGAWSCDLTLPNGAVTLTVVQRAAPAPSPSPSVGAGSAQSDSGQSESAQADAPQADSAQADATQTLTLTLHVLGAPTVQGSGSLVIGTTLTGSGYPGAIIALDAVPRAGGSAVDVVCPAVGSDGGWSCQLDLASGDYAVRVRQYVPGHPEQSSPSGDPRAVTVDRDAPAAPVIAAPAPKTRVTSAVAVSGSGEDGATVSVFANGSLVCASPVTAGAWSCTAERLPGGRVQLQALQRDAVGNYSSPSAPVELIVTAGVARPVPAPSPSEVTPAPGPTAGGSTPATPGGGAGSGGGSTAAGPPAVAPHDWSTPTGFGAALPAVSTALDASSWAIGLAAAGVFIVLVALPLRLAQTTAQTTARGRLRMPRILGRNHRGDGGGDGAPTRSAEWMPLVGLVAGVGIVAALLAVVQGQTASVRLIVAVVIALAVLNAVGVVLAGALAARAEGARRALRVVPFVLVIGAIGVLASRLLGIDPPIVVGVVLASAAASATGPRTRGVIQLAQLGAMELLAVTAWIARDAVGPGAGVWGVGLGETLAAVTISGLASVVVLLVPVGRMPGRAIFEWSRPAWAGAALLAVSVAAIVLGQGHGFPVSLALAAAATLGAACVGAWAWFRWVDPAFQTR